MICTPEYQAKYKSGKGYLWDELIIIQSRWKDHGQEHGVFPLVRSHNSRAEDVVPASEQGSWHRALGLYQDSDFEQQFAKLIATLKAMTQKRYQQQNENVTRASLPNRAMASSSPRMLSISPTGCGESRKRVMQRIPCF